jgi:hypothetical protein
MPDTISLIKANPLLPAEDYTALRKQGFKAIERLGSSNWTDYNNSDPGITILEAVCYAITDLAYRTGFEVKDILAPEHLTEDTWRQIFYTARQILHNSPLTINDYRKLIIDVKGVRNAWLEPSKNYEVPIYVDYNAWELRKVLDCSCEDSKERICLGKLRLDLVTPEQAQEERVESFAVLEKRINELKQQLWDLQEKYTEQTDQLIRAKLDQKIKALEAEVKIFCRILEKYSIPKYYIPSKILELEGFYNVMVEYEEDVIEEQRREAVRQVIMSRLSHHRNLCEDFLSINAIEYQDFGIGASIELEEYADPDVVLAEIFFSIYKYFSPSIPFHTIDQMLAKGYQVDEIFEDTALEHGFIDTLELEKTDLFRDIRLSDIINAVSDIKGIKGILYLHLPFEGFKNNDSGKDYFNSWIEALGNARKIARIQPTLSQILFCKERDFISYYLGRPEDRRPDRMLKLFKDKKTLERKYKLEGQANDFPVPSGEYMELEDYYPITQSLPLCYGVNERTGLPRESEEKRKTQVLQLKGYLLFFEQILAGYLVQLNHVKDLFTFDESVQHTYFSRMLDEVDQLQALLVDHNNSGFDKVKKDFSHTLQNLLEPPSLFGERRNRFLNHLLARFSEDMSEYERISRWLTPHKVDERLIKDKINMLKNGEYFSISSNRGLGYDYASPDFWNTSNISGIERRVSRLLGLPDAKRKTLVSNLLVTEPVMENDSTPKKNAKGKTLNIIKLLDPNDKSRALLTSVEVAEGCCTEQLMYSILENASQRKYFIFKKGIPLGTFCFELWDGSVKLATGESFNKKQLCDKALHKLLSVIETIDQNEGLHLIEHILLRPKFDKVFDRAINPMEIRKSIDVSFPLICLDDCDVGIGLREGEEPLYYKNIHRIPDIYYELLPWVLEYMRNDTNHQQSILWQQVPIDGTAPTPLRFRGYEDIVKQVRDLQEFGSEHINYEIVSNQETLPKYGFIIHGEKDVILAQSLFMNTTTDIEEEIEKLTRYFGFELDWYGDANPCDNNEDPYSFRTTAVLPCWPKRFRDPTFRNLVEKTLQAESPAHVHTRIVWLGVQEMQHFETAYSAWLLEMSQTEMPSYEKTNLFVDVLNNLRPCGLCEDECDQAK